MMKGQHRTNWKISLPTLLVVMLMTFAWSAGAQQQFISEGKIEYERKTNQHAFLDENNMWDEMAKSHQIDILCAYPLTAREENVQAVRTLCAEHTAVEIS